MHVARGRTGCNDLASTRQPTCIDKRCDWRGLRLLKGSRCGRLNCILLERGVCVVCTRRKESGAKVEGRAQQHRFGARFDVCSGNAPGGDERKGYLMMCNKSSLRYQVSSAVQAGVCKPGPRHGRVSSVLHTTLSPAVMAASRGQFVVCPIHLLSFSFLLLSLLFFYCPHPSTHTVHRIQLSSEQLPPTS